MNITGGQLCITMIELGTSWYIAHTSEGKGYVIQIKLCTASPTPSRTGKGKQLGITMTWLADYTSIWERVCSYTMEEGREGARTTRKTAE